MGDALPNEKIFVGDTPVGADEFMVGEIFKAYGSIVDLKVLPPKAPGEKGAALIRYETLEEAAWIVDNLNGHIPQGMAEPVFVSFARPSGGGGAARLGPSRNEWAPPGQSPYGGGQPPVSEKIFVGDVPQHFDENSMRALFEQFGAVVDVKMLPPRAAGEKGAALVRFSTHAEAKVAVDGLNGQVPYGLSEPLYVQFAKNPSSSGSWQPPSAPGGAGQAKFTLPHLAGSATLAPRAGAAVAWKSLGGGGAGGSPAQKQGAGRPGEIASCSITAVVRTIYKANVLPGAGQKPDANTIYIRGIPRDTTDLDLYKIFAPLGAIAVNGVKAMTGPDGACKGVGFVDYVDPGSAALAVSTLNGYVMPDSTPLVVELRPPSKYKGQSAGD